MSTTKMNTKPKPNTTQNEQVIKIKDLSRQNIIFTEVKTNTNTKTNGLTAAILNATTKKPLLIEFSPTSVIYPISDYQGNKKFALVIKNLTNNENDKEMVEKLFTICNVLNEMGINYIMENKKTILKPKEAAKLTRDLAETSAFFGPCCSKDSRDEDQIKLNIMKDYDSDKPNLYVVLEESKEEGGKSVISKETVVWDDHDDPWEKLKSSIRPGMTVQGVIQPRIYFVNSKMGINFKLHALKVSKTNRSRSDIDAVDLNADGYGFSEPKSNKEGRMNALILNNNNATGKIIGSYHRCIYGVSKYESAAGTNDYSIYIKNETDIPQEQEGVNQLFEFSKALTDKGIDWTVEHKDKLFKPKEAKKITRSIAESAYFNSLVGTDKEGNDQIKLKIMKTMEGDLPNFKLIEEIIENDTTTKNVIDWNSYDEPWEELRKLIRPGMHIKPTIQPRIYIVNNKVGINYRLSELIVQKMPTKRFDASSYAFSSDKKEEEEELDEEEEIDEAATEETDEAVEEEEDPEAFGIESDEDVDEEAEESD